MRPYRAWLARVMASASWQNFATMGETGRGYLVPGVVKAPAQPTGITCKSLTTLVFMRSVFAGSTPGASTNLSRTGLRCREAHFG